MLSIHGYLEASNCFFINIIIFVNLNIYFKKHSFLIWQKFTCRVKTFDCASPNTIPTYCTFIWHSCEYKNIYSLLNNWKNNEADKFFHIVDDFFRAPGGKLSPWWTRGGISGEPYSLEYCICFTQFRKKWQKQKSC
jgi:hypothetical protein